MLLTVLYFCLGISFHAIQADNDYRWENYNGTPPEDAFEVHYNAFPTQYIGQVEIPGAGKCIGILKANEMELRVNCNGDRTVTENIKILCVGHQEYYEWKDIKSEEEYRAVLKDNELVKSGYDEIKKVDTFVGAYDTAPLKIGNLDKEEGTVSYDGSIRSVKDTIIKVLIYKPTPSQPPAQTEADENEHIKFGEPVTECANTPLQPAINSEPTGEAQTLDYRWENYNGTPPEDAFEVHYKGFETQYIGQVEIPGAGKCIGILHVNKMELRVNCNGDRKVTENIKILCVGHQEYYEWKVINSEKELRAVIKDNELVIGGYNETKKLDTFVGAYDTAPLYIGNIDKEEGIISYNNYRKSVEGRRIEILIYKPPEEPPKEKPNCSDLLRKGVDITQVRVGIDCLDVEVQTPSEINPSASSPNLPNVKIPSQTKVESNPTVKTNIG